MIRIILSDIFNAFGEGCEAICHQVNCQGVMNSGLAKDISKVLIFILTPFLEGLTPNMKIKK